MARKALGALLLALVLMTGCGAKPAPTMNVTVQQVGQDLQVKIETTNFVIPKDGHAHLRLNGGPEVMPFGTTYTFPNLAPGKYLLDAELSDERHSYIGVKTQVEFEVK